MSRYTGDKIVGQYDFYGSCAPREDGSLRLSSMETFTLGIFRIESYSHSKKIMRGQVLLRVKGDASDPSPAYALARQICDALEAGKPLSSFKKIEVAK